MDRLLKRHITFVHLSLLLAAYALVHARSLWGLGLNVDELTAFMNVGYLRGFPVLSPQAIGLMGLDHPIQAPRHVYYWALDAWSALVGFGVPNLRLFSVVMGFLCTIVIYTLGRTLFSISAGFFGALAFVFCLPCIEHTAILRLEASYWFFWYLSLLLIVRFGRYEQAWIHIGIGLICGVAALIHVRGWAACVQAVTAYAWIRRDDGKARVLALFAVPCGVLLAISAVLHGPNVALMAVTNSRVYEPNSLREGARLLELGWTWMTSIAEPLNYFGYRWGGRSGVVFWKVYALFTAFAIVHLLKDRKTYGFYFTLLVPTAVFIIALIPVALRFWMNLMPFFCLAQGVFIAHLLQTARGNVRPAWRAAPFIVATALMWTLYDPARYRSIEAVAPLIIGGLAAAGAVGAAIALLFTLLLTPEFIAAWMPVSGTMIAFVGACAVVIGIDWQCTRRFAHACGVLLLLIVARHAYALASGHGFPDLSAKQESLDDFLALPRFAPAGSTIIADDRLWWAHRDCKFYGWQHSLSPEFETLFKDVYALNVAVRAVKPDTIVLSASSTRYLFHEIGIPVWWLKSLPVLHVESVEQTDHDVYFVVRLDWRLDKSSSNKSS